MKWVKKYTSTEFKDLDCTQYLEQVLRDHFKRNYTFPQREGSLFFRSHLIKKHLPTFCNKTETPKDGDLVLMHGLRRMCHVGLYVKGIVSGYVLHKDESMPSGAYHRIKDLVNYGYTVEGFYTWVE